MNEKLKEELERKLADGELKTAQQIVDLLDGLHPDIALIKEYQLKAIRLFGAATLEVWQEAVEEQFSEETVESKLLMLGFLAQSLKQMAKEERLLCESISTR